MNWFLKLFERRRTRKVHPEIDQIVLHWNGHDMSKYHWWPMKEAIEGGESPENNLYALGGGIDKYDKLFNVKGIEYQKSHYFRSFNSTEKDAGWAGFCDCATTLACTLKYPKNLVIVHYNGKYVEFTPKDIEHLMIIASRNSTNTSKTLFYGERCNYTHLDDRSEPYPTDFLNILKKLCVDDVPFALDIDKGPAVWNYPYNKVKVTTTKIIPEQYKMYKPDKEGDFIYYHFIIESSAYPSKNLDLWGWRCTNNYTDTEGWFCEKHPDFAWKKYPRSGEWKGVSKINPEINANHIYEIYMASMGNIDKIYI